MILLTEDIYLITRGTILLTEEYDYNSLLLFAVFSFNTYIYHIQPVYASKIRYEFSLTIL